MLRGVSFRLLRWNLRNFRLVVFEAIGNEQRDRCHERLAYLRRMVGYCRILPVPQRPRSLSRQLRVRLKRDALIVHSLK